MCCVRVTSCPQNHVIQALLTYVSLITVACFPEYLMQGFVITATSQRVITRKMFPYHDVIMCWVLHLRLPDFIVILFNLNLARSPVPLQWRHNGCDGVSNRQPHDYLLNRLFKRRSKNTSKLHVTGLCEENSSVTGEFPARRPVTRKMFPFDDVIM